MFRDAGTLRYRHDPDGLYRLVVEVDPILATYYRALLPPSFRVNRSRYAPHITVVREASPMPGWGAREGGVVPFEYAAGVHTNDTYAWLEVHSEALVELRRELGLVTHNWYTRPPDEADCYHLTIGNFKP